MLQKLIKAIGLVLLGLFAFVVLGAMLGPGGTGWETLGVLCVGWLKFLQRTLPNATVNWSAIGMVVLCSLILISILHWFCKWLYRASNPAVARAWPWRWTMALFASLWLTFGIVIGASGAARHIKWLAESDDPMYRRGINPSDFRMTGFEVCNLLEGAEWEVPKLQGNLMSMTGRGGPLGTWDQYEFVFLTNASNRVASVLILPRDPTMQRRFGFLASSERGQSIPIEQLPNYIRSK